MIKALVTDIDGTIIRHLQISDKTREIIQHFQENQLVILNTGRAYSSIQSLKEQYDFDTYDFAITCNGSYICTKTGHVLYNTTLDKDTVEGLLYDLPDSKLKIASQGELYELYAPYQLPEEVSIDSINKISIRLSDQAFEEELKRVAQRWNARLEINTHYADLIPPICDKGEGTRYLLAMLGIYQDEVVVIGDDYNDIPMLESFDHSYTFKDSPSEVKLAANHIIKNYSALDKYID